MQDAFLPLKGLEEAILPAGRKLFHFNPDAIPELIKNFKKDVLDQPC
jgi:hypothetical protein